MLVEMVFSERKFCDRSLLDACDYECFVCRMCFEARMTTVLLLQGRSTLNSFMLVRWVFRTCFCLSFEILWYSCIYFLRRCQSNIL